VDFAFSDEQIILRDSVRKMMDRIATPDYVRRRDRDQAHPDALYAAWVEMGRCVCRSPRNTAALDALDMVVLADEMARTFSPPGAASQMQRNVIAGLIGLKVK
jgi:alkylation response protein AidB-like acyl-CoA dehydrogenase